MAVVVAGPTGLDMASLDIGLLREGTVLTKTSSDGVITGMVSAVVSRDAQTAPALEGARPGAYAAGSKGGGLAPHWLLSLFRRPARSPQQAARVRQLCVRLVAQGGMATDDDPITEDFADVIAIASRRGLIHGGGFWRPFIDITPAGEALAAESPKEA
jgi:hypothetical protein